MIGSEYDVGEIQEITDNKGDFFMLRCKIFTDSDRFVLNAKDFYTTYDDRLHIEYDALMSCKIYWVILNVFCHETEKDIMAETLKEYISVTFEQENNNEND